MASIIKIGSSWRALVRKAGHYRVDTFKTQAAARSWARTIEAEIEELKSTGHMQPRGTTLGDLIDRYNREIYPLKLWGRSKSADLKRIKEGLGHILAAELDYQNVFDYFIGQREAGCGGVTISSLAGYLIGVLETAADVWRLAVPVNVAKDVRGALKKLGMIKKSRHRTRRVLDAEVGQVVQHLKRKATALPIDDILWFCLASAMRISEVCRLRWEDLNETDRTVRIRDRKHPTAKIGNHYTIPLLTVAGHDAYAIVARQPRNTKRIFPANSKTVSTYFTEAVAELEIKDLHLHDLRHEGISRLFEAGYHIEEVSLVSGHRDWSSLKRYTHLRAKDLHRETAP